MYSNHEHKIPLRQAIGYVFISVLVIWGSLIATWFLHAWVVQKRQGDSRYTLVALVQTCPQKESLPNWQLLELLELARDKPVNLYTYNSYEAANKLLACPVIKKALCRRLHPGILHVDYHVRTPYALLADFSNTAVDKEKFCFPLRPYFTPKSLPELYLGINELPGAPLDSKEAILAFKILEYLETTHDFLTKIVRIDTHKAFIKNAGLQEVVVVLEVGSKTRYLRLNPQDYQHALNNYLVLQSTFDQINPVSPTQIIDLRSPSIALVK